MALGRLARLRPVRAFLADADGFTFWAQVRPRGCCYSAMALIVG